MVMLDVRTDDGKTDVVQQRQADDLLYARDWLGLNHCVRMGFELIEFD